MFQIQHIGDSAGHSRREFRPVGRERRRVRRSCIRSHDHRRLRQPPAHRNSVRRSALQPFRVRTIPPPGAIGDDIAGNHVIFGGEPGALVGSNDEPPARQPLPNSRSLTEEPQRDAARHEGAERLPGRAVSVMSIVSSGRPSGHSGGHLRAEHGADPCDSRCVRAGRVSPDSRRQCALGELDQRVVQCPVEAVVLRPGAVQWGVFRQLGVRKIGARSSRRPSSARSPLWCRASQRDRSPRRCCESQLGQVFTYFFGNELEEVDDEFRPTGELLTETGFCVRTPTGRCRDGRPASSRNLTRPAERWRSRILPHPATPPR